MNRLIKQITAWLFWRDFFAAQALCGQLQCMGNQAHPEKRAEDAYKFADEMLKERLK